MIQELWIQNYAIIDEIRISFSPRMTTITGETGAGKSILLGALSLVLGERADTSVLYQEEKKCIVEAIFQMDDADLTPFFTTHDIDQENEIIVRREISPSGKSRAFINDTPVRLYVLKELSTLLIDLHRQFDTHDIHQVSFQINTLDALASQQQLVRQYQAVYHEWLEKKEEVKRWQEQEARAEQEKEFLQFQYHEIEKLALQENEQEKLELELDELQHAEEAKYALQQTQQLIEEADPGIHTILSDLVTLYKQAGRTHHDLEERLRSCQIELDDIARESSHRMDQVAYDPKRAETVQHRLDQIYTLLRKHQVENLSALLAKADQMKRQINDFSSLHEKIKLGMQEIDSLFEKANNLALTLSKGRKKQIQAFEEKVEALLYEVAMPNATFSIRFEQLSTLSSSGIDEVQFTFSANKGAPPQPIKQVASGGELSRLALCVKSIVAAAIPLPSLVFDEIDSGVSGDVSLKMGRILFHLSRVHQVVVITHSPQISAQGDIHYFVYKETDDLRTYTKVKEVKGIDREVAIASMLSTDPPTKAALANAKELLSLTDK